MKIKKTIRTVVTKTFSIALVIMLIGGSAVRYPILAQEETPPADPTPSVEQTTPPDPSPTVVETPEPTPTEEVTPDPTPVPTDDGTQDPAIPADDQIQPATDITPDPTASGLDITNDTVVDTNASAQADTGNNTSDNSLNTDAGHDDVNNSLTTASSNSDNPSSDVSEITGTAAALTTIDNNINSTAVNSQVIAQTINVYIEQDSSLDLSDPTGFISGVIQDHPDDSTINLHVTAVHSGATVTNTISSEATSGNNSLTSAGNGTVTTGDAYSLVSIMNRVNLLMIDSVIHIVTINIFGILNGDIILPMMEAGTGNTCDSCGGAADISNTASVTNTIASSATSGNNALTTSSSGSITTGDAASVVNINNLVNTTVRDGSIFGLYINAFGDWEGSFVGYGDIPSGQIGGLVITGNQNEGNQECCTTNLLASNNASVTNTVNSTANSGGNTVNGASGNITTGNAVSEVSIINLVNTVLYRTTAFFGFINVFGSWHGNTGDAASLAKTNGNPTPTPTPEPQEQPETVQANTTSDSANEAGGMLTISQSNNTGAFINPGDTVTFFMTLKNPGNGRVYDTNVILHLFKDGYDVGGATVPVGTIKIGGTVNVSVGLVLSHATPPGPYLARAIAMGKVGPSDDSISAIADSEFTVSGSVPGASTISGPGTMVVSGSAPPHVQVLGATTKKPDNANILLALLVLLGLGPEYVFYRASRDRKLFTFVFTGDIDWQARLRAASMLLL